jgi:hypothetical protein
VKFGVDSFPNLLSVLGKRGVNFPSPVVAVELEFAVAGLLRPFRCAKTAVSEPTLSKETVALPMPEL